jgi:hypothetical protein
LSILSLTYETLFFLSLVYFSLSCSLAIYCCVRSLTLLGPVN